MSFRCRLYIPPSDSALHPAPGGRGMWGGRGGEGGEGGEGEYGAEKEGGVKRKEGEEKDDAKERSFAGELFLKLVWQILEHGELLRRFTSFIFICAMTDVQRILNYVEMAK